MKSYILSLLIALFISVAFHDYIVLLQDRDTQNELIMQSNGVIDFKKMCRLSKLHDFVHEILTIPIEIISINFDCTLKAKRVFIYNLPNIEFYPKEIYHPPIHNKFF